MEWEEQEGRRYRFGKLALPPRIRKRLTREITAVSADATLGWGDMCAANCQPSYLHSHFLRYEVGDTVPPPHLDVKWYEEGQQVANVLIYLSGDLEGGETVLEAAAGMEGHLVKPSCGALVMWRSMLPWGPLDPRAIHTARPVKRGTKIVLCIPLLRVESSPTPTTRSRRKRRAREHS